MNFFLKAKHWHLFILVFGLPMILQFIFMYSIFSDIGAGNHPGPGFPNDFMAFFIPIMVINMFVLYGWNWTVATTFYTKLPTNVYMRINRFKIFFIIPIVYITLILIGFTFMTSNIGNPGFPFHPALLILIIPLHIFSMFCLFYSMYFVAKTLKSAELQREATFSDYAGEFFCIWFYVIGIWILQPKINRMSKDQNSGGVVEDNSVLDSGI